MQAASLCGSQTPFKKRRFWICVSDCLGLGGPPVIGPPGRMWACSETHMALTWSLLCPIREQLVYLSYRLPPGSQIQTDFCWLERSSFMTRAGTNNIIVLSAGHLGTSHSSLVGPDPDPALICFICCALLNVYFQWLADNETQTNHINNLQVICQIFCTTSVFKDDSKWITKLLCGLRVTTKPPQIKTPAGGSQLLQTADVSASVLTQFFSKSKDLRESGWRDRWRLGDVSLCGVREWNFFLSWTIFGSGHTQTDKFCLLIFNVPFF